MLGGVENKNKIDSSSTCSWTLNIKHKYVLNVIPLWKKISVYKKREIFVDPKDWSESNWSAPVAPGNIITTMISALGETEWDYSAWYWPTVWDRHIQRLIWH